MESISRRSFVKTTATATAAMMAVPLIKSGWLGFARADAPGYFLREFGITDELCQKILAKALSKGGDFADLYFEHSISNWIILEDGIVNRAYGDIALGVGIRTVKGDQVGYGFTQELTDTSMLATASTAATIADSTAKQSSSQFIQPALGDYYPMKNLLTAVPLESKLPLVQSINEKCFALSPLVIKVNSTFHDQQKRILIVSSNGTKAEDLIPRTYLTASVTAEKNGRRERSSWNFGGRREFSYYTPEVITSLAKTVVDNVVVMFDAVKPPAGEMPVVLGTGVTGILLHEAIGHGMEADFNRKKISTYTTMIGKKVAEPEVTIIDDATIPNLLGSINVDDEGIPGRKTILVDKGILTSYMHDIISSKFYNVEPTGNGRRESYKHYIQPRMRNTYMLPGSASPEDVIKSVDKGIYIQNVSNGQVKIGEGDFAFYVSQGRMIEKGKLTAPIKDVNIMGNGPKMLANVTMVASDLEMAQTGTGMCGKGGQAVPVGFGLPTTLVKSMTVGGVQK
jgi:TldD protein